MTKTPDQTVAERIVAELRERGLLSENRLQGLAEKLAAGTMKAEEWERYVEFDRIPKEETEGGETGLTASRAARRKTRPQRVSGSD
jgi:hypothetical protein